MALESGASLNDEDKELLAKLNITEQELYLEVFAYVLSDTINDKITECMKNLGIIKEVETPAVETPAEPVVEAPAEPVVETPAEPKATNKAQKLENRINNLIEKLENETNPIRRQLYTARIAWLSDKFANALKIQQIKEEFDRRRTVQKAENLGKQTTQKIGEAALQVQIEDLREQISDEKKKLQPKFDPESPKFIFKSELARYDNIESLLAEIESTPDGAIIAEKIRATVAAKEAAGVPELESKLGELETKLAGEKSGTIGRRLEEMDSMRKLKDEERSLVSTEKKGLFKRIGDWGKALAEKWNDRKREKDAIKDIKAEGAELVGMYQADVDTLAQENAEKIADLKRQIAELEAQTKAAKASVETFKNNDIAQGDKRRIDQQRQTSRVARAEKFREDLTNIRENTQVDFKPKAGETQVASVDKGEQGDDEPEV